MSTVWLCVLMLSPRAAREMHYKVLALKGPQMAAAKLGQPWRGLVRHFLGLCVVECCVPQGLPVIPVMAQESPGASPGW